MTALCEPCGSCSISGKKAIVEKLTADIDRLMAEGAYQDAYPISLRLLEEAEGLYGSSDPDYASILNDVASVERGLGRYDEAEKRFRAAARILREALGDHDSEFASVVANLAGLHRLTGDLPRAEEEFERALGIYERELGFSDWRTISCLNNLGLVYQDQGRYEEAIGCHVRALELLQDPETPDDPSSIATTLMNGAVCSAKMGDQAEAAELFDCAMELIEQVNGRESAAYAGALNNIAAFELERGDARRAVSLLRESEALTRGLFGEGSSALALVRANLRRAESQGS
ncbi:MAG: tetratricopeptide repeat protein [Collinsella sp.]|nr:tetratricopeptide repeat protein [Collinsella sp.]